MSVAINGIDTAASSLPPATAAGCVLVSDAVWAVRDLAFRHFSA